MLARFWIISGSLLGLLAVAMAAALAHALPARLDEGALQLVRTAQQIQSWHAIILVVCGILAARPGQGRARRFADLAGGVFLTGTLAFCGGVYALAILGLHIPLLAPIGGTLLMLGWLLLAIAGLFA